MLDITVKHAIKRTVKQRVYYKAKLFFVVLSVFARKCSPCGLFTYPSSNLKRSQHFKPPGQKRDKISTCHFFLLFFFFAQNIHWPFPSFNAPARLLLLLNSHWTDMPLGNINLQHEPLNNRDKNYHGISFCCPQIQLLKELWNSLNFKT